MSHIHLKSILIIFTFFFTQSHIVAQSYIPFPTENARWKGSNSSNQSHWTIYEIQTKGDTTISGLTYTKLWKKSIIRPWHFNGIEYSTPYFTEGYVGCFRNDSINKKVYLMRSNTSTEIIWYDFDLQVGDSIDYGLNGKVISNIDSVIIDGIYHNRFAIDSCNGPLNKFNYLIEGIGSTYGLLAKGFCSFEISEDLNCVTVNESVIYNGFSFDSTCSVISRVPHLGVENNQVYLFPNPAQNEITFHLESNHGQINHLIIMNSLGQKVLEIPISSAILTIDVSRFGKGIYFYTITNEETLQSTGKFLKL